MNERKNRWMNECVSDYEGLNHNRTGIQRHVRTRYIRQKWNKGHNTGIIRVYSSNAAMGQAWTPQWSCSQREPSDTCLLHFSISVTTVSFVWHVALSYPGSPAVYLRQGTRDDIVRLTFYMHLSRLTRCNDRCASHKRELAPPPPSQPHSLYPSFTPTIQLPSLW